MKRSFFKVAVGTFLFCTIMANPILAGNYKNFTVSIYTRYQEVQGQIDGSQDRAANWAFITGQMKVDKVYLELTRNRVAVTDEKALDDLIKFYKDKGITVAAGLGLTVQESAGFQSFCYTNDDDRAFVKRVSQMAAKHFDEIILDDFYFNNTKTDSDIKAKGDKTWTQFRLELMREVSKDLIVDPIHAINPKCKVVIKYPNWYEHFQNLGYDLDQEPKIFDGIYTGTETRQPTGDQHLQQYQSYQQMRYFENIKPGGNGGGWVDTGGATSVDRYAEQLWNTVFAKCPEMTLFAYNQVLQAMPPNGGQRTAWADQPTSFNYNAMMKAAGPAANDSSWARVAGYALEQADSFLGNMGKPIGVKSYKPYQSEVGEEFLHNYLGMIGVPIDLYPTFPTDAQMVLLTEHAKYDPDIVEKIKGQLTAGKNVCITSGLLKALQGKGIEQIVELSVTGKSMPLRQFGGGRVGRGGAGGAAPTLDHDIFFPEIRPFTNDAWADLSASLYGTNYPIIIRNAYSKGTIYVLNIPDNPAELYNLPQNVLTAIRQMLCSAQSIRIDDAPAGVAIFTYDNNTYIVENYASTAASASVSTPATFTKIHDLINNSDVTGQAGGGGGRRGGAGRGGRGGGTPRTSYTLNVLPHSYMAFAAK